MNVLPDLRDKVVVCQNIIQMMKIFSKDVVGAREADSPIHNTSNSLPNTVKK